MKKGDRYRYLGFGDHGGAAAPLPIEVLVTRVARDGTWANITCTGVTLSWTKRQPLPFPATFRRVKE